MPSHRPDVRSVRPRSAARAIALRVAIGCAIAGAPTAARAQFFGPMPVVDAAAIARLGTQIKQQLQQLGVARNQLQLEIANMKKLGNPGWRKIAAHLLKIDALNQQGYAIWY